jgi:hypothetical protein
MSALCAFEHQGVLTKLIAQLVDMKFGRHAADCYGMTSLRPSSTVTLRTLYKQASRRFAAVIPAKQ